MSQMSNSGVNTSGGERGEKGESGTSLHMQEGAPSLEEGNVGDVYINKENGHLYGPKTKTGWPYCGSIVGPEGLQGVQGTAGSKGETGSVGSQGSRGEKGERGEAGTEGVKGSTGTTGSQGTQGEKGPAGSTGPEGLRGLTGTTGSKGETGAQGAQGEKGATGTTGSEGPKGSTGSTGATGPEGLKGTTGSTGAQGVEGPKGSTGLTGATGPTGPEGAKGSTGSTGAAGESFSIAAPVTGISITSGTPLRPNAVAPCGLKILATMSGLLGSGLVTVSTCSTESGTYKEVGKVGLLLAVSIELGSGDVFALVPTGYYVKIVVTGVTVGNVALSGVRWDL